MTRPATVCPNCGTYVHWRASCALKGPRNPFVVRASTGNLPVHRDPSAPRETVNDIIRRTMPPGPREVS